MLDYSQLTCSGLTLPLGSYTAFDDQVDCRHESFVYVESQGSINPTCTRLAVRRANNNTT